MHAVTYQSIDNGDDCENESRMKPHAVSSPLSPLLGSRPSTSSSRSVPNTDAPPTSFVNATIYGVINAVMAIPSLYGYAFVIFNHSAFVEPMDALAKLVVWSSAVHQICFSLFSTLPMAIGQVQDAGLIFLSHMASSIANSVLESNEEGADTLAMIVSTVLVTLSFYTMLTGVVLLLLGKFGLGDLVSYLPLPVVGGYLAFIGYFCFQAGVSMCISKPMQSISDWSLLLAWHEVILAFPGVLSGILMAAVSRRVTNDIVLPILMVLIPLSFYVAMLVSGSDMEHARSFGWLGEESVPVPVTDLFSLVDFSKVQWQLIPQCASTWLGMVFVVSFGSCLDVSAISMDMGKPLDMNVELTTVGISNTISGLLVGFCGSYIFSQTIFTLRTGCRSRAVGAIVAAFEIAVVLSTINMLEVVPLFFLGSTLIFIGIDLIYEWLWEIRHKILLSEYCVLLVTFAFIQGFGINFGIVFGIVVSILDYVVKTAQVSSINQVSKRSRAVWKPDQWKLLQNHGYHIQSPRIVTFEIRGTLFFGSSLQLLTEITEQIGLDQNEDDRTAMAMASPGRPRIGPTDSSRIPGREERLGKVLRRRTAKAQPKFVVLDLLLVSNVDSSAARGCFCQLGRMCARNGVVLCASGANARVAWVLQSHEAATIDTSVNHESDKMLLFETVFEALEFCEFRLISDLEPSPVGRILSGITAPMSSASERSERMSLSEAFHCLLGLSDQEEKKLEAFERERGPFHDEIELHSGETIFEEGAHANSFFVVLGGSVALFRRSVRSQSNPDIFSGAGTVPIRTSRLGNVETFVPAGSIFGFVDYVLDQAWQFSAVAAKDGTVICKLHREGMAHLQKESPELDHIVHKVLLKASTMELAGAPSL